jgi:probable phosphoglycerate mutase
MSQFYLIRHGDHDWLKKGIAGRIAGVHLNALGLAQAEALPQRLESVTFAKIITSPLERAIETGAPLARAKGLAPVIAPEINELDFGDWNGQLTEMLHADPRWADWVRHRSVRRMPGGELITEVQARVVGFLERLHLENPHGHYALFSHGDSIRSALCHWMGLPLDLMPRLQVDPASISILSLDERGPMVLGVNLTA